jgi:type IV pilus assembly protein PilA
MKQKKGFTLIELLAVILILGIIALIAIPTVTNIIKESKRGAFKSSVQNVIGAVEMQCQLEQMRGEKLTTSYIFTNGEVDNELNVKGDLPQSGTITVDSDCNATVDVSDGAFNAKKSSDSDELVIQEVGEIAYTCKRATTLHEAACNWTKESLLDYFSEMSGTTVTEEMFEQNMGMSTSEFLSQTFCTGAGYTATGSKGTSTITYGQIGTKGILSSGDAFDCDVNNDGKYDPATERFYYVSDYYNTTTKQFESDKATLIYYNNTTAGIPDNTSASFIAYDSSNENWHGPVTAITNLPTREQWTNPNLITGTRDIIAETGANSTSGGTLPIRFDYSKYAVRLLTTQELSKGCGITIGEFNTGELDNCNYLLENTDYESASVKNSGYWLETPVAGDSYHAWFVDSGYRRVYYGSANNTSCSGARSAITLLKSNISY